MNSDAPLDLAEWSRPYISDPTINWPHGYVRIPPAVLARLVTCARALIVLENIAGPIPFVRHTAREALVGIIDTKEPPHD